MFQDQRGLAVTADSAEAVRAFDRTVTAYLGFGTDTAVHLKHALAADPAMPMALIARACFFKLFSTREMEGRALRCLADARAAVALRGGTPRERRHLDALAAWCRGDFEETARIWDDILIDHPLDVLALRLAHYIHFYLGSAQAMCDSILRTDHAWTPSVPGYGFVRGFKAFALEEAGHYEAAERAGREAIAINPADVWATHAVAHVMEMQGRHREGVAWLDGLRDNWEGVNHFIYHVWWHKALFHLDIGDHDAVLDLHDARIRAEPSEDYLDISNGVALLWRLEKEGVDVGDRWEELGRHALPRLGDHMLVFADLHYLMAFAASGRAEAVAELLASTRRFADTDAGTQADVARSIGLPLMEAVVAAMAGDAGKAVDLLMPIRQALPRIGGSHAQRDLFHRMLIEAAIAAGRLPLARALLDERGPARPNTGWTMRRAAEVAAALAHPPAQPPGG